MNPSEVLTKAADLLEEEGWIQGAFHTDRGRCSSGAIFDACGGAVRLLKLYGATRIIMCRSVEAGLLTVWNDAPGRTAGEVIAAFRSAAELAAK